MSTPIKPQTLLVVAVAGWIQREQQAAIVYDERRRLAVKGKALGRKLLAEVAGIFTPETLLAWHRSWQSPRERAMFRAIGRLAQLLPP